MKIFRGPKEKDYDDDSYEMVCDEELSKEKNWDELGRFGPFNLSKQDAEVRGVSGYIEFGHEDIIALHGRMLSKLIDQSKKLHAANLQLRSAFFGLRNMNTIEDIKTWARKL